MCLFLTYSFYVLLNLEDIFSCQNTEHNNDYVSSGNFS